MSTHTTPPSAEIVTLYPLQDVALHTRETLDGFVRSGQEQALRSLEQVLSTAQEQVNWSSDAAIKNLDALADWNRRSAEILIQSGAVSAKAFTAILRSWSSFAQTFLEQGVNAGRAMAEARTVPELVDIQATYTRQVVDDVFQEAVTLSDITAEASQAAMEPLSAYVHASMETLTRPLAA